MKKFLNLFYLLMIGFSSFANNPGEIDKKLVQSFNTSFPNATNVTWHELPEFYSVNFVDGEIRANLIYRKDGSFVRLIRNYTEQTLPFHIYFNVKEEYPDKKIFGVTEISNISETGKYIIVRYYLKLEDTKNWMTVRFDGDGNSTVVEKFRKAK